MKILEKTYQTDFPLKWANLDYYPDSIAKRKEIYLNEKVNKVEGLSLLFFFLFGAIKNDIGVYNNSWWDFCLDTWDPQRDAYNYEHDNKSVETKDYFSILKESAIEQGYGGCCKCLEWEKFLPIVLRCIVSHQAPFSPLFYSEANDFFFYFHHSGSIGFYYDKKNDVVAEIIKRATGEYELI